MHPGKSSSATCATYWWRSRREDGGYAAAALGGRVILRGFVALLLVAFAAACASPTRSACEPGQPLGTICGFNNPEDIAFAARHGVLVVSQMALGGEAGSIAAYELGGPAPKRIWPIGTPGEFARLEGVGDPACAPVEAAVFAPHGIVMGPKGRAYIVNHGGRESVEILSLEGQGHAVRAVWRGCIELPAGTSGNDIAVAGDGEIIVANYMPSMTSLSGGLKTALGMVTGDILAWRPDTGWRHVPNTEASAPNGVAISPDGQKIFFAETGGRQLVRLRRHDGGARAEVEIDGALDNLSWTRDGQLLVASHDSLTAFLGCATGGACRSPWSIWSINPDTLAVQRVFQHDGSVVGAVASAEEVGGRVYLSAVFGDRIGVWQR
ncbi:MAG: hypothetical protein VCC00_02980 [Deltaproteobacteria bacterium]